jgi:hypothetical protein
VIFGDFLEGGEGSRCGGPFLFRKMYSAK